MEWGGKSVRGIEIDRGETESFKQTQLSSERIHYHKFTNAIGTET